MTEETKSNLALALSRAQGKLKGAKKDTTNPFFKSKYADLASVWDACRQALSENELAVIQAPMMFDGVFCLKTKLIHSSGEFEESIMPIAALISDKAQIQGSALTYARRYSLAAMVGVAPDEDDDGNAAQQATPAKVAKKDDIWVDFGTAYAGEIKLCDTPDKLDVLVQRNAVQFSKMKTAYPAGHDRITDLLDQQRASFIKP